MGWDYEILSISTFESRKSAEEIQEMAKKRNITNFRFLKIDEESVLNSEIYTIEVETENHYGKSPYLGEKVLALLIKDVIAKDSMCTIRMAGEDSSNWGYAIRHDGINEIQMRMVEIDGDVTEDIKEEIASDNEVYHTDWGFNA